MWNWGIQIKNFSNFLGFPKFCLHHPKKNFLCLPKSGGSTDPLPTMALIHTYIYFFKYSRYLLNWTWFFLKFLHFFKYIGEIEFHVTKQSMLYKYLKDHQIVQEFENAIEEALFNLLLTYISLSIYKEIAKYWIRVPDWIYHNSIQGTSILFCRICMTYRYLNILKFCIAFFHS